MTENNLLLQKDSSIQMTAYAKINLALDVTGKLDNGYHLVKMIMETISIHDEITIKCSSEPGIRMTCSREDLSCGEDNLVIKAAKAILEEAGLYDEKNCTGGIGFDIYLEKNIPMAAGMAGGSTDAAAVLKGLNQLLQLDMSLDKLCEIGVRLGADIPYCIRGGSYLSEGIGEILTPVSRPPMAYIAVIKPPIDVSTKYVYEHLDTDGVAVHPDVDGMLEAMDRGSLSGVGDRLGNVLRDVTIDRYPVILELENYLRDHGAVGALMSGSGPTVFGLFEDPDSCLAAVDAAVKEYPDMFVSSATFME